MTYGKITKAQFDEMQFNAGVIVRAFNPALPSINDEDIVCATSGGITINIKPEIVDLGADVYMMPPMTAEMVLITDWTVECEFSSITYSESVLKLVLGATDVSEGIAPRDELKDEDFTDIWWIGDRVDGGLVAVKLINVLSEDGFSFTTQPNSIGGLDVRLIAHSSFDLDGAIPVEIYSIESYPILSIYHHMYLLAENMPDTDIAKIDEQTGILTIEHESEWTYSLNSDTGIMEVSK